MKASFKKIISFILTVSLLIGAVAVISASAEAATPRAAILSKNAVWGETVNLQFAVCTENLAVGDEVSLTVYDKDGAVIEKITKSESKTIFGYGCKVFTMSKGVPAQKIGTAVYPEATVTRSGNTVAVSAREEYSVLEYVYDKLINSARAGNLTEAQEKLYTSFLTYAENAELVLTDTPEGDRITDYRYVKTPTFAGMLKEGDTIPTPAHGLDEASANVVWQSDLYSSDGSYINSTACFDSELSQSLTVGKESIVLTARSNKFTESDYYNSVATYGSAQVENNLKRGRIIITEKLKAGTKITFDSAMTSKFRWAVVEAASVTNYDKNGGGYDSGWNFSKGNNWYSGEGVAKDECVYVLKKDTYVIINVADRADSNNVELTKDEISNLHSHFKVDGYKVEAKTVGGELTGEEFLASSVRFGNIYLNIDKDNNYKLFRSRFTLTIPARMMAGTKISFAGNNPQYPDKNYKWAVLESNGPNTFGCTIDSGWFYASDKDAVYTTEMNGAWISITVMEYTLDADNKEVATVYDNCATFRIQAASVVPTLFDVHGFKYAEGLGEEVKAEELSIRTVNHRGYSSLAPENTLAAYRLSKSNGFNAVECDVSFTKDGYAVLLHDSTVDRTSNGTGKISELTLAEVKALDFGSWKSIDYKGEKIPTFDEFMALCKSIELHPYIEIKNTVSAAEAKTLVDTVNKYGMMDNCTWISYSQASLTAVAAHDGSVRLGYLTSDITSDKIDILKALDSITSGEVFLDAHYSLTETELNLIKSSGFALEVYTVNSKNDMKALDPYITAITTDWISGN